MFESFFRAFGSDPMPKPETSINSDWSGLCDSTNHLPIYASQKDSIDRDLPPDTFLLQNLFSEKECTTLINAAETSAGFGHTQFPKTYRGNLRLMTTDHKLAVLVWSRIIAFLPARIKAQDGSEWKASGLNERWRLAKYYPGDKFKPHVDAFFRRSLNEKSMFTVNVYMNGNFEGGRTRFLDKNYEEIAAIKGEPGLCLIFRQPPEAQLVHDGEEVTAGVKYLYRTDVMYTRVD